MERLARRQGGDHLTAGGFELHVRPLCSLAIVEQLERRNGELNLVVAGLVRVLIERGLVKPKQL